MFTPVPGASIRLWILPRTKKVSTGHFVTPASLGPAFRIPLTLRQQKQPPKGGVFIVFVEQQDIHCLKKKRLWAFLYMMKQEGV